VAAERLVHYLILPNNPADAYVALREFVAFLEPTTANETVDEDDEE
jgi:hypothetical protein